MRTCLDSAVCGKVADVAMHTAIAIRNKPVFGLALALGSDAWLVVLVLGAFVGGVPVLVLRAELCLPEGA